LHLQLQFSTKTTIFNYVQLQLTFTTTIYIKSTLVVVVYKCSLLL
jgi:hypothetical protein